MFPTDLQAVKTNMQSALRIFDAYKGELDFDDYSPPILAATRVVESMLVIILADQGCIIDGGMVVADSEGHGFSHGFAPPLPYFCRNIAKFGLPQQIVEFVNIIRTYRNHSAHCVMVGCDEFLIFWEAITCFTNWFVDSYCVDNKLERESIDVFFQYAYRIRNSHVNWTVINARSEQSEFSSLDIDAVLASVSKEKRDTDQIIGMLGTLIDCHKDLKEGFIRVEKKIDTMVEQLGAIYEKITDYQSLLQRQLDVAVSDDEIDRIIKAYSDELSDQISRKVFSTIGSSDFDAEARRLQDSLGEVVWDRMDPASKEFLITAKVTYGSYAKIGQAVDYSGVCLLVTKAIEVEMSNRFCRDYLLYLKSKYPGKVNHSKYPVGMLNKHGKPIRHKDFTLGSVAYVLGVKVSPDVDAESEQRIHDEIYDFCRNKIMVGKDDVYIADALEQIAEGVETVRQDYRNPSAHTNQLQKVNAKECFDLVLDVEKLLKTIIECLDY